MLLKPTHQFLRLTGTLDLSALFVHILTSERAIRFMTRLVSVVCALIGNGFLKFALIYK